MAGNSFGELYRVTTFGESHGPGVGVVIDGCPPRVTLLEEDFVRDMARRRPGKRLSDTERREEDRVEILSGVFEGQTTGAPITLFIRNRDADSRPYEILRHLFRPGHGDYTYFKKYGHFDFRGGGRYSARETAARVAAGVVAKKILEPLGVKITGYTIEVSGIKAGSIDLDVVDDNPLYCPDPLAAERMEEAIARAKGEGDSVGGVVDPHYRVPCRLG
jgi:chorismate synthase